MRIGYEKTPKTVKINLADFQTLIFDCMHWHKHIEICKMVKGKCDFLISGKTHTANEGDILVVNSGELHKYICPKDECTIDICTFNPLILYKLRADLNYIKTVITSDELKNAGIDNDVYECFYEIHNEFEKSDTPSEFLIQSSAMRLYALLLRNFEKNIESTSDISKLTAFTKILEYISDNSAESINLKSVAKHFGYTPEYMSEFFKKRGGVGFKEYIDNVRTDKALDLLLETDMPITAISQSCGFENIRTFNNVFKRITGKSPSSLRKQKS